MAFQKHVSFHLPITLSELLLRTVDVFHEVVSQSILEAAAAILAENARLAYVNVNAEIDWDAVSAIPALAAFGLNGRDVTVVAVDGCREEIDVFKKAVERAIRRHLLNALSRYGDQRHAPLFASLE